MINLDKEDHWYPKHSLSVENTNNMIRQTKCWGKVDHLRERKSMNGPLYFEFDKGFQIMRQK